ncbi:MAG: S-methyl-5'-thioadenosine phosphorylase [Candidatus Binatia bacterium]|nr:S-methyl-5'-thioadenosine phosphorylase [Candidatus Binatia bacterium]
MEQRLIGVIGGTGLYQMEGLERVTEVEVETPFGKPSDPFLMGSMDGMDLVFLPRHGKGHRLLPTELNFRANLFGLKKLGVEQIISVSAVGSLREEIAPGNVVIPDQFIDRTSKRPSTFFGHGIVAHVGFADPFCPVLREGMIKAGEEAGARVHPQGTYLCMEGPQFSTRAESDLYRSWGAHIIGMTNLQEAKLAREAEICFVTLALATDYDCWNEAAGDVEIEQVLKVLQDNARLAQGMIQRAIRYFPKRRSCMCASSLKDAIVTEQAMISEKVRADLDLLIGKYLL